MQFSFGDMSVVISMFAGFGILIYKFARLERRVDRLEGKVDEVLYYIVREVKHKKLKHLYMKK